MIEPSREVKGTFTITDANGENGVSNGFSDAGINFWRFDSKSVAPVLLSHIIFKGEYILNLTIREPAPALANIKHTLVARYMICGLKAVPAVLLELAGFVSICIAVVIIIVMVLRSLKRRRRAGGSVSGSPPPGHHISKALIAAAKATPAADIALIIFFIASDQASARSATSSIVITQ